jgi:trk system potassium uptake protein TrkH
MNHRLIARFVGILLTVEAVFMATSIIWAVIDHHYESIQQFAIAVAITGGIGLLLIRFGQAPTDLIHAREAVATVAIGWILVGLFGAIPFLLTGAFTHLADAFFESVSGFTTTGASALTDVETLPRSLLWWRSIIQWMGGMGIIVLFIAILPRLGVGAGHLFRSEVPGPITQRLRPKLRHTSLILWYVYLGITAAEAVLLVAFGMEPFHAMCHSFTTMATGGFSTLNQSVAGFGSVGIEIIIAVFMFLAGVNFNLYFRVVQGRPLDLWRDPEFRTYLGITLLAIVLMTTAILPHKASFGEALRHGSFQVVSIQTTTGYATDDFNLYPPFGRLLLVGLMFIGGSAGSTAGGVKIARFMVLGRGLVNQLIRTFHPRAVLTVKIGNVPVEKETVLVVAAFFGGFTGLFFVGSLLLAMMGLDIVSASTAVIASLGNIGPGLARVGPTANYAFVPPGGKIILSALMILGRLEILTVLALLVPSFWRK